MCISLQQPVALLALELWTWSSASKCEPWCATITLVASSAEQYCPLAVDVVAVRDKLVDALQGRGYTACCCHVEVGGSLNLKLAPREAFVTYLPDQTLYCTRCFHADCCLCFSHGICSGPDLQRGSAIHLDTLLPF